VDGEIECVGGADPLDEICNCEDDDCDGEVDEDVVCPDGGQCSDCECQLPCSFEEFELECPPGKECIDGFCAPGRCEGVECPEEEVCREGVCVDLCEGVDCGEGYFCRLGRCVEDNCYGTGCPAGEICLEEEALTTRASMSATPSSAAPGTVPSAAAWSARGSALSRRRVRRRPVCGRGLRAATSVATATAWKTPATTSAAGRVACVDGTAPTTRVPIVRRGRSARATGVRARDAPPRTTR
jgi:hypothetical protein